MSARRIVIDAACLTDCDRRGLATFTDAAERALADGIPLAMSGLRALHREMLDQFWGPSVAAVLSSLVAERLLGSCQDAGLGRSEPVKNFSTTYIT